MWRGRSHARRATLALVAGAVALLAAPRAADAAPQPPSDAPASAPEAASGYVPPPPPQDVELNWIGTELILSYRDTAAIGAEVARYPATRVAFLGIDAGGVLGRFGPDLGWLLRVAVGASLDWAHAFSGPVSVDGSFGGSRLAFDVELHLGLPLPDGWVLTAGLGYQGMKGPITENSSIAVSVIAARVMVDADAFRQLVRITPLQLLPANERWVASPLSVEWRAQIAGLISLGVELQYVPAPDLLVISDTPAEAFAVLLRVGSLIPRSSAAVPAR